MLLKWLLHQNLIILRVFIILLPSIFCLKYNIEELKQKINKDNGSLKIQAIKEAQKCFSSTSIIPSGHHPLRSHRRLRRAPAVWGDPAPDYSLAALDPLTNIYLYALLFVDLKTSDHYRRDHILVKREYFYQINLRLVVVDVLETFREDLSLYTFELYRNSRMAQLPFHDFAVLISYRYAGGLAFVGGMCNSKSVMLAGFYPHNPEAMASIFFHEVAHLIGVPHRPENETLNIPNCACNNLDKQKQHLQNKKENKEGEKKLESKSSVILDKRISGAGCLKIPGFDQDCTLQLMVNMALRTRCLLREPKAEAHTYSLAICGNGVREEGEQCDCGLIEKCKEWNCEPERCIRRWPLWAVWALALILGLIVSGPFILWLLFPFAVARLPLISVTSQNSVNKCHRRYYHFFVPIPPFVGGEENNNKIEKNSIIARQNGKNIEQKAVPSKQTTEKILSEKNLKNFEIKRIKIPLFNWFLATRIRTIWERIKWAICSRIIVKRRRKRLKTQRNTGNQSCDIVRRPIRPPPPPPLFIKELSYSSNTLKRPKRPPPPLPSLPISSKISLIRPNFLPPSPPFLNNKIEQIEINNNYKKDFNGYFNNREEDSDDDENRWNDNFDDD